METETPGKSFRDLLRAELKERSKNNPNYSLRSFARHLTVAPSGLSSIMSGKRPVTLGFIEKTAKKLKLPDLQIQQFQMDLLGEKSQLPYKLKDFEIIEPERFALVRDWYHYAILNLMRTKGFKSQAAWVAKRLGLSLGEVQSAVERLQAAGLLKVENGKWTDFTGKFTSHTNNKVFSEAARLNQVQLFQKASQALDDIPFAQRNHTGVTLAFSKNDLSKAKDFITKFRKEFMNNYDQTADADDVYHLSVAFFPLSESKK